MISARVLAYSKSAVDGKEIVSYEVEFPRMILSEWNTHGAHVKNAQSTRAVPILSQLAQIAENPAMPIFYGKNESGMVANEELDEESKIKCESVIKMMLSQVTDGVKLLQSLGLHKQHSGRYLEPWMHVKGVVTATNWNNFFWLRDHPDAQPEIRELAKVMKQALKDYGSPVTLEPGDWHTPYFGDGYWLKDCGIPLENALKISASCTAQVSYRKADDTLEKAEMIYGKLIESEPVHASPVGHAATPIKAPEWSIQATTLDNIESGLTKVNMYDDPLSWEKGVTHLNRDGKFCSNNFEGFIQYRALIPNNVKKG